ncbi:auxin-induced protein 22B-like [Malania oleifera]|uniref:auxin-induced protein 22B-like n=1 Tax=Malania oleifera TaxID=397392 RepID=UPI0025AE8602|nr:auxin-induced protein 22B-like [Malania oleifera]
MAPERSDLNMEATELRLGLPGTEQPDKQTLPPSTTTMTAARGNKRALLDMNQDSAGSEKNSSNPDGGKCTGQESAPQAKTQVVGWPPIRSYRKNCFQQAAKKASEAEATAGIYVKVSMDGAPYLRKIDLKVYNGYSRLLNALEDMFKFTVGKYSEREGYNGSEYAPTYEDKDGDWMLVGDVPWEMFISSCKRLRIMKGTEAKGLGCVV